MQTIKLLLVGHETPKRHVWTFGCFGLPWPTLIGYSAGQ